MNGSRNKSVIVLCWYAYSYHYEFPRKSINANLVENHGDNLKYQHCVVSENGIFLFVGKMIFVLFKIVCFSSSKKYILSFIQIESKLKNRFAIVSWVIWGNRFGAADVNKCMVLYGEFDWEKKPSGIHSKVLTLNSDLYLRLKYLRSLSDLYENNSQQIWAFISHWQMLQFPSLRNSPLVCPKNGW